MSNDDFIASPSSLNTQLSLQPASIQTWTISLPCDDGLEQKFKRLLSPGELLRFRELKNGSHGRTYAIAHGVLRVLLGRYIGLRPEEIVICKHKGGKPYISSVMDLRFNMSHSGTIAVYAFALGSDVGVDVELVRPVSDLGDIVDRFFCDTESTQFHSIPEGEREIAFFSTWTRKEACLKAVGAGIVYGVDRICVDLDPRLTPRVLKISPLYGAPDNWKLLDLPVPCGYVGTVAYRAHAVSQVTTFAMHTSDLSPYLR